MEIRTKTVEITGTMPLLMHWDNLSHQEMVAEYRANPEKKNKSKKAKGDDREPAWVWIGHMYNIAGKIGIPSDNLMTMLREGGAKVPLPDGRANETCKKISQSGLLIPDTVWELKTKNDRIIPADRIMSLMDEFNFETHRKVVNELGFDLLVKRARVTPKTKHVRVRPLFEAGWQISGDIAIIDPDITDQMFEDILNMAGRYVGLGDWRPSSPNSPGPYGMFKVAIS